jgi:hypothetical protein
MGAGTLNPLHKEDRSCEYTYRQVSRIDTQSACVIASIFCVRHEASPSAGSKVAQACNRSYSGGRDQEDHSSKPAWANSSQDPILKKFFTRKVCGSGSRCRPWVQVPVQKKERERERERVKEVLRDRRYEILVLVLGCGSSEEVEGLPR